MLTEAAWKDAMKSSMQDYEEDDEDSGRNYTHHDLFMQLKRNIKRNKSKANAALNSQVTVPVPEATLPSTIVDYPQFDMTASTVNNAAGVFSMHRPCNLEEEEEDYEAPTYTTPLQAAPPPPLSLYSSSSTSIGRQRKGSNKSSRMKKRNSSVSVNTNTPPVIGAVSKKPLSPKKDSPNVLVSSSASITMTSLEVDSPAHSVQHIQYRSPDKPIPDIIHRADAVLADIEHSLNQYTAAQMDSSIVLADDELNTNHENADDASGNADIGMLMDALSDYNEAVDHDIVLSEDDEDDSHDSDEAEVLLYTSSYDIVKGSVDDAIATSRAASTYESDKFFTSNLLAQVLFMYWYVIILIIIPRFLRKYEQIYKPKVKLF